MLRVTAIVLTLEVIALTVLIYHRSVRRAAMDI